jgi:TRAP-type transport system periplasmic protein
MKLRYAWVAVVAALVALGPALAAQRATVTVRLGTIAPQNSIWHNVLREMGDAWRRDTGGRVALTVQVSEREDDIYRQMTISRQLQAASITAIKLSDLDDAFSVFGIPLFYRSYEEVDRVLEALTPELDRRLDARGLKRLNWGHTGWVHVFSRQPVTTLAELKRMKLFTSTGDTRMADWYRRNGFNPVPLDVSGIASGLPTGQVDVLPATPLAASYFGWYRDAPHMLDLGLAPLIGATVMSMRTWGGLSSEDQARLLAAARQAEDALRRGVPEQDREAVEAMKARTLTVTTASGPEWREAAEAFAKSMRGTLVPEVIYDQAVRERDAAREGAAH